MMRLDKYLADCGIGTRAEVKKVIKAGKVQINGQVICKPETKVNEVKDTVMVNNVCVRYEKYAYYLFHKPAGCVTAVKDNLHKTVMDFFPGKEFEGFAPVGRLDLDTEGFLLVTNDGQLAHHLISPSHHVAKTYYVELDADILSEHVELFRKGFDIGDETPTLPADLVICKDCSSKAYVTLYEGRFHQVKRMFQAIHCNVIYLKRVSMGGLKLGDLPKGNYRKLTIEEVELLSTDRKGV